MGFADVHKITPDEECIMVFNHTDRDNLVSLTEDYLMDQGHIISHVDSGEAETHWGKAFFGHAWYYKKLRT